MKKFKQGEHVTLKNHPYGGLNKAGIYKEFVAETKYNQEHHLVEVSYKDTGRTDFLPFRDKELAELTYTQSELIAKLNELKGRCADVAGITGRPNISHKQQIMGINVEELL